MSGALGRLPYPQVDPNRDANSLQSYLDQIGQLRNVIPARQQPALQPPPQALLPQAPPPQPMAPPANQFVSPTINRATLPDRGPTDGTQGAPGASPTGSLVGQPDPSRPGGGGAGGAYGGAPPNAYQARSPSPAEALVNPDTAKIHEASQPIQGASTPPYHELKPGETSADTFHQAISQAKRGHEHGAAVTLYDKPDYKGMRLFTTPKKDAGFALKGDDIVSVFKHPNAPHEKVTRSMLDVATAQGGRRLDAFDTALPHLYSKSGFRVVARLPWNEEYAPKGWKHETFKDFNGGRPDVVFMVHDPKGAKAYKPGDGKRVFDYDEAVQAQHDALAEIDGKRPNALKGLH